MSILNRYAINDSRIFIINKPNKGVSVARNIGIEKSTGKYMMFNELKKYGLNDDYVIIASGVSDSKEIKTEEFSREENLIKDILLKNKGKKVTYFSTCSVLQVKKSLYIHHKLRMEEMIRESDVQGYIFRLPQVVGVVNNNTLVSYFVRNAYLNSSMKIQENTVRNLLDIEDVARIVITILESNHSPNDAPINIASTSYISVYNIAKRIISILHSESDILIVPGGEKYYIENSKLKDFLGDDNIIFSENYASHVVEKYTSKIKDKFSSYWDELI